MNELPDLSKETIFPLPESSWIEFKSGFGTPIEKIYATLCGFLNGDGGYLIIGVQDKTRSILGIQTSKIEDNFRLSIDNIYHLRKIVTTNDESLTPENIKIKYIECANNKKILVITAKPTLNKKYKINNEMWYRLSASNYKMINDTNNLYSQEKVNQLLKSERDKSKHLLQSERDKLNHKIIKIQESFEEMVGGAKQMEKNMIEAQKRLKEMETIVFSSILLEKEQTEELLEKQKEERKSWWSYLMCLC